MTQRYRQLVSGVRRLRQALLPAAFSPTGEYRNAAVVHLRSASFRMLCHSEIESYLEDVALGLQSAAWSLWKQDRYPSHTLTCLLGFAEVKTGQPAETRQAAASSSSYVDVGVPLEKANSAWRHQHKTNNGIKESDVLRLFLPIGIEVDELDQTLLNDLSSYGISRGEVAHRSATSITQVIDPSSEFKAVQSLLAGLRNLDLVVDTAHSRLVAARQRLEKARAKVLQIAPQ